MTIMPCSAVSWPTLIEFLSGQVSAIYNKGMSCNCNKCGEPHDCGQCQPKCGCPEQILSIEADTTRPAYLRFNLGGRSVWHDFTSVVKGAETCTTLKPDITARSLIYDGECGRQVITAAELGSVLHLADIGDVDTTTISDNALLVYKKEADCGENCDGKNGWIGLNPSEETGADLDYILGSDADGEIKSLAPPTATNKFRYLAWAAENKASWTRPSTATTAPQDSDNKVWRVYMDPNTEELIVVKEDA